MLNIQNLHVKCEDAEILKGINLNVKAGEVHAIMGPNGSGKSTLSKVIAGHQDYEITEGQLLFNDNCIEALSPEERAHQGIFLSFQYPVEIPGVTNINFLKASVNAVRKAQDLAPMDAIEFLSFVREQCQAVGMDESFLYRSVNEGFSGGEKKRNEILQMSMLQPKLAVLDETDSGLDIDALKTVAEGINAMRSPDRAIILVTHYQRLLDYIEPDHIHVLAGGKIVRSGDKSLALELETKGYRWLEDVA
jgi:Fe-S cluster assembly ATP-binding protein